MDRIAEHQVRLQLPYPYVLFKGLPPRTTVQTRTHGWSARGIGAQYEFDYGERPVAYAVPAGAVPPSVLLRDPAQIVFLGQGLGVIAPAVQEDEYGYQYIWTPFAVAVQGLVVPTGKLEHAFVMPDLPAGPSKGVQTPDDIAVLRLRWRGVVQAAQIVGVGAGTPGPYTLDFTVAGAVNMPIVPGTVLITATTAGGPIYARDLPWPTAVEAMRCETGRLIGDVSPGVESTINYRTGVATITFNANIVAASNILADYESEWDAQPLDARVQWDTNAI